MFYKTLENYLMYKLDKENNNFTEEELDSIDTLNIYLDDEEDYFDFKTLGFFKNLKRLTLRRIHVNEEDFTHLLNLTYLEELFLDNCLFDSTSLLAGIKLKILSFENCVVNSYSFISLIENLEYLTITGGVVNINKINRNLSYLRLSYSYLDEIEKLEEFNNLETLYIDNTNIDNFDFLNKLEKLKKLSIDLKQYEENKHLFNNLISKGINIYNENLDVLIESGELNE